MRAQLNDRRLRRHRRGQDDAAQRAVGGSSRPSERIITVEDAAELQLQQPHVDPAGGAPAQRRGQGPGHDPRPGAQLAAHAPRPHHRRRGPRRRDARHAAGDEHRPRRLAGHACTPTRAEDAIHRLADARLDERGRDPVRGAARPDQLRDRRDRPARPLRRRRAAGSPRSPSSSSRAREDVPARRRSCASSADPIGPDRGVTGHLGALPAARRRRRPPARQGRDGARRLHRARPPTSSRRPSASTADDRVSRPRSRMPRWVTGDRRPAGLLVLAGTVVATAGAWDLLAAGATREELRERGHGERAAAALGAPGDRLNARLRAHAAGPAPAAAPRRRRAAAARRCTRPLIALAGALAGLPASASLHRRARSPASSPAACVVVGLSMWLERKRETAPRRVHGPAARARADALQRRLGRPVDGVGLRRSRCRSSTTRPRTELRIAEEIRIGQPFERALESLGERLPSREVAVLMTTIAIQQRAGGDTVRALSDLAATLEARRETQREIKTLLSGATATLLRRHGHRRAAALFLADLTRPGTLRQVAVEPARAARAGRRRHPVRRRLRADPADHEDRRMSGALRAARRMARLRHRRVLRRRDAARPGPGRPLRDGAGRRRARAREPRAGCSSERLGPARRAAGHAPAARQPRRAARRSRQRIDSAGRPGGLTVSASSAARARFAASLGLGLGALRADLGQLVLSAVAAALPRRRSRSTPGCTAPAGGARRRSSAPCRTSSTSSRSACARASASAPRCARGRVQRGARCARRCCSCCARSPSARPRRDAFDALRERNTSDGVNTFVAAVQQAEELGVPLTEALNDIARDMRQEAFQRARQRAQRAAPRVVDRDHADRPGRRDHHPREPASPTWISARLK